MLNHIFVDHSQKNTLERPNLDAAWMLLMMITRESSASSECYDNGSGPSI
ncbi:hypothetical protein JHK86_010450 [Glycine max]|nr:hypothetical protein JHK86_010450 [Glycine max]